MIFLNWFLTIIGFIFVVIGIMGVICIISVNNSLKELDKKQQEETPFPLLFIDIIILHLIKAYELQRLYHSADTVYQPEPSR